MNYATKDFLRLWGALVASYFTVQFISFWWEIFCLVAKSMINGFILDGGPKS